MNFFSKHTSIEPVSMYKTLFFFFFTATILFSKKIYLHNLPFNRLNVPCPIHKFQLAVLISTVWFLQTLSKCRQISIEIELPDFHLIY